MTTSNGGSSVAPRAGGSSVAGPGAGSVAGPVVGQVAGPVAGPIVGPILATPTATLRAPPAAAVPLGFRAELTGASLWDLVQMECLGRSRRVVQVAGEGGVGYLYFAGGRVVHAVTPRLAGEAAALEILSWTNGSFQACERAWPTAATIDTSHEALILQAAKRRDETAASNLVAFRGRQQDGEATPVGTTTGTMGTEMGHQEIEGDVMAEIRNPNISQPGTAVSIARAEHLPDFSVMIRVGANGAILKNKGAGEEMAGVVAYALRLVELVGDLLGLDRFVAMECTFKEAPGSGVPRGSDRCLLFTEANGDSVALRPRPESNIQPLRESLGL
jgi:Domain of unknown function (DUF4388)